MKSFIVALTTLLSLSAFAGGKTVDASQDIDTLGGNEALINMASALNANNRSRIVQSRTVDRNLRFEFGVNYGGIAGGDSYVRSQLAGLSADFHINPKFSLGVRYNSYQNQLSSEGERVFSEARTAYQGGGRSYVIPDIDYALDSTMAVFNWFPIYGKINMFDTGIAQFDMYLLGGGGNMKLESGNTTAYTAGLGVGFWMGKHFTTHGELRWQGYKDQIITGSRDINTVIGSVSVGFLL